MRVRGSDHGLGPCVIEFLEGPTLSNDFGLSSFKIEWLLTDTCAQCAVIHAELINVSLGNVVQNTDDFPCGDSPKFFGWVPAEDGDTFKVQLTVVDGGNVTLVVGVSNTVQQNV